MRRKLSASIALTLMLTMLMTLTASAQEAPALVGEAKFRDKNAASDSLVVTLREAAVLSPGSQYEGWLVDIAGNMVSTGTYGRDPELLGTYVDPEGANLLAQYPTFIVSIEPNPDSDPEPSGEIAYGASVPIGVNQLSIQLTSETGPARGMYDQALMAIEYARNAQEDELGLSDLKNIAQSMINFIEGANGVNYDASADGVNAGDGVGLMGHAPLVRDLAERAKVAAVDIEHLEDTADEIVVATEKTEERARRVRDAALRVLELSASDPAIIIRTETENLLLLSTRMLHGIDSDGEDGPGSTGSEGGARTVYEKSQDLTQFQPGFGEPPAAGDTTIPTLALTALAVGALLLAMGGLLVFRGRRTPAAAIA